jgi:hypothetical protein
MDLASVDSAPGNPVEEEQVPDASDAEPVWDSSDPSAVVEDGLPSDPMDVSPPAQPEDAPPPAPVGPSTNAPSTSAQLASFDRLARQFEQAGLSWSTSQTIAVATLAGSSVVFSAGYVLWAIRGGSLLASVLCAVPAWRFVDPIPVLEFSKRKTGRYDAEPDSAHDGSRRAEMLFQ